MRGELDHKNLNQEVPGLYGRAITTECLAQYIHSQVTKVLPIHRARLHETPDFFAEYWIGDHYFLGLQQPFSAAHRLHSHLLLAEENAALYGKCNNLLGHGHRYLTEATVSGPLNGSSGTLVNLSEFQKALMEAIQPWQDKHLDIEVEEFRDKPSTGENIVQALWPRVDSRIGGQLVRLRLWETANNRFTLRRT